MFGSLTRGLNTDTPSLQRRKRGHRPEAIGRLFTESLRQRPPSKVTSEATVRGHCQRSPSEATVRDHRQRSRQRSPSEATVRGLCQRSPSEATVIGHCQRSRQRPPSKATVRGQRDRPLSKATFRGHRQHSSSTPGWAGAEAVSAWLVCHFLSVSTSSSEPFPVKVCGAVSYSANERPDI